MVNILRKIVKLLYVIGRINGSCPFYYDTVRSKVLFSRVSYVLCIVHFTFFCCSLAFICATFFSLSYVNVIVNEILAQLSFAEYVFLFLKAIFISGSTLTRKDDIVKLMNIVRVLYERFGVDFFGNRQFLHYLAVRKFTLLVQIACFCVEWAIFGKAVFRGSNNYRFSFISSFFVFVYVMCYETCFIYGIFLLCFGLHKILNENLIRLVNVLRTSLSPNDSIMNDLVEVAVMLKIVTKFKTIYNRGFFVQIFCVLLFSVLPILSPVRNFSY